MPAPILMAKGSAPQRLAVVNRQLTDEFDLLLTFFPPRLFEIRDGDVVLTTEVLPHNVQQHNPVFARLCPKTGAFQDQRASKLERSNFGPFTVHSSTYQVVLRTLDDRLAAFHQVPPLSWIKFLSKSDGGPSWSKQTIALIEYFFLLWAVDSRYAGSMPKPNINDLKAVFRRLKQTQHYQEAAVRHKKLSECFKRYSSNGGDIAARHHAEKTRQIEHDLSNSGATARHPAPSSSTADCANSNASRDTPFSSTLIFCRRNYGLPSMRSSPSFITYQPQHRHESVRGTQPHLASVDGKHQDVPNAAVENDYHLAPQPHEQSSRAATNLKHAFSQTSSTNKINTNAVIPGRQEFQSVGPTPNEHADSRSRTIFPSTPVQMSTPEPVTHPNSTKALSPSLGYKTPPTLPNKDPDDSRSGKALMAPDHVVDKDLSILQQQVGPHLLSSLPSLETIQFKRLDARQLHPDYLPVRMLFGTVNQSAPGPEQGRKVWVLYRIHEKDAKSAPRLMLDAFSSEEDRLVQTGLPFKKVTTGYVDLEPAFTLVTGEGIRREHQLKALIKYYFILAANARMHDFQHHLMPVNSTFVDQLRVVTRRISNRRPAPAPRKRQRVTPDREKSISASPEADLEHINTAADDSKWPVQSRKRLHSEINAPVAAKSRKPLPPCPSRKVAYGPLIHKGTPNHKKNQFLDPDIEAHDSDGESGDEIPARIPMRLHEVLSEKSGAQEQIKVQKDIVGHFRAKKKDCLKEICRIEKQKKKDKVRANELDKNIEFQRLLISICDGRVRDSEKLISKFEEIEKKCSAQLKPIGKARIQLWEALEKEKEKLKELGVQFH